MIITKIFFKSKKMLQKIVLVIIGIGIAVVFFPTTAKDYTQKTSISGAQVEIDAASQETAAPEMALSLSAPIITARSAVVYDLSSGTILYSKNLDEKLPIASLTKLMTALVVFEKADLNAEAIIRKEDLLGIGNTVGLVAGEKIKVSNLLKAMLIPSGNDAALALASFVGGSPEKFAEMMNAKAGQLNLVATKFSNPAGWDNWAKNENFSNSLDLIKITQEFLSHEELWEIVKIKETVVTSVDGKYTHRLKTTNQLLLDNPNVEGIKTGFTSKALGNLITLYNHNGTHVLTIILNSDNREDDSRKLIDWALTVYKW
jgi:D-alanyl-D-alanine carboxypeptidase (penicillin-binding protein 5/6)